MSPALTEDGVSCERVVPHERKEDRSVRRPNCSTRTRLAIVGPVTIGDNARGGANAVVTKDVPADTTVVGIPARPVNKQNGASHPIGS